MPAVTLRQVGSDAPAAVAAAAELYLAARRAAVPVIAPIVHCDDDVRQWFQQVVAVERELWLAEQAGGTVAVMVLDGNDLDQLYVRPDRTGHGIGSQLVASAKRRRPTYLGLWTFQSNTAAQRFYERHGFVAVLRTDGRDNEEGQPDIRYEWTPEIAERA